MDTSIITRFLTKVGRSYYRSPEFEQERASLAKANCDFDPCSRFGIGLMSCFMLGDQIVIRTRRYYGSAYAHGEPLIVEISGLGGIITIRKGHADQPIGTTIEIIGKTRPALFDEFTDEVRLIKTIDNYALGCEFPIIARCEMPEIRMKSLSHQLSHFLRQILNHTVLIDN